MRVHFTTLGCKVNQYETQILSQLFSQSGFDVSDSPEGADIFVVNSCTVTATGDKKTRQSLRRMKREHPGALVALTGCFPQAFPEEAAKITEADVITGSYNRKGLLPAIQKALITGERVIAITPHAKGEAFEPMEAGAFLDRTRAFVKIEDGCDRYCSYCIIPTARGPIRSKPLEELRRELVALAKRGYQEAVLVGINLSSYGRDLGLRLIDAVELACSVDGIRRVRLGSLEPELLTGEDIERMSALPKFCPQFHLSLQSGCDATLQRMNRHYDRAEYRRIVDDLRAHFPGCAITTDVMVGFPGETEEEFAQSLQFVSDIAFAKAHVFAYSVRPGTRAASLPGQVSPTDKEARSARMIAAAGATRRAFLDRQRGLIEEVLFETGRDGVYEGYTKNYTPVRVKSPLPLQGAVRLTEIGDNDGDVCEGVLLEERLTP
ncbi:tRNA (N(6)-L-threonylcarbamoyladenosine(37)-C(2))-methylthiotransferase MtaB [Zongyangia hominis]|uniref:tRNA (N(6)-L-threonylcarbamoyladenosine(37)-C(2))-methylthiotransferase MtaB n=1 Tax=Zongyangia hominis TaxID=2763677 RepID=A0A926EEG4_9FIRM|nr:tRNA (N(6)-L-threonylcarbamoyladenosine(37)-C(2))-methylthiotransferase MtaB [Zongyangia hominis]MBC8570949.1 tRNA (N(6)-L-threonylcarbamoyladenosine(37)-C(2))-methylthiotransferase MtaB [Zongyangia hominis]